MLLPTSHILYMLPLSLECILTHFPRILSYISYFLSTSVVACVTITISNNHYCIFDLYCIPGIVLSALHVLSDLTITTYLKDSYCYDTLFTEWKLMHREIN